MSPHVEHIIGQTSFILLIAICAVTLVIRILREVRDQKVVHMLEDFRSWAAHLPWMWKTRSINAGLYLCEHSHGVAVRRVSDNSTILVMDDEGHVSPLHIGIWEPEFTAQIAEALVVLAKLRQEIFMTQREPLVFDTCGAQHKTKAGVFCERDKGHTQYHANTLESLFDSENGVFWHDELEAFVS